MARVLREEWEVKKLSEIGKIFNGNSINAKVKKEKYTNIENGYYYIATKDISYTNKIDYDNGVRIPFEEKSTFKIAPKNTILICAEGGSAGRKIGFTNQDVCFGNKLFALIASKDIDSKFVYYFYFSEIFKEQFFSELVGIIGGVSMNKFKNFEIPLPLLQEQQKIVAILDEAFSAIDKAKANAELNLKNAKELFESYLQSVFENRGEGWEEKQFDEVCILQRGFDLPTRLRNKGSFPLVSSNGITDKIDIYKVKSPGVVTGRSGTIGNVHFIEEDFFPLNTALFIKEFYGNYEKYIYYFLKKFDLSKYSSGSGVPTLNRNNVHSEKVWFLKSIQEQQTIVKKLDTLSELTKKLESHYKQKLQDLDELKKSFLQKAFNGELL